MSNNFKPSDAAISHCQRLLLQALQQGPLSTIAAREQFGIQGVAPRILELRRCGWNIETRRRRVTDKHGRKHAVAVYVLHADGVGVQS